MGGKLHLMLYMYSRPIVHKYHEGKMKRTLERELKVIELAEWEADGSSEAEQFFHILHIAGQLPCTWNQICAWCFLWCLLLCLSKAILKYGILTHNAVPCCGKAMMCCLAQLRIHDALFKYAACCLAPCACTCLAFSQVANN